VGKTSLYGTQIVPNGEALHPAEAEGTRSLWYYQGDATTITPTWFWPHHIVRTILEQP